MNKIWISALACVLSGAAWAQTMHEHPAPTSSSTSVSAQAYQESMQRMHADMNIVYSGDADVDFVRGMIPHHQAAVEMAQIQLKYGKDPVLRQLSEEIIAAQAREIKLLQDWLQQHDAHQHH